ncbi:uncharacterized protein LOC123221450 [Mangifera indica]|uniref:uncharacterized protein LOC123221450 n=1 Tax=Mangifera indica TaxID=29780 RepID=UPI001CF9332E|nr:uncharacterized protein LOC123221450 [Mangifera indica]
MVSEQGSDNGAAHRNPSKQPMEETLQATQQQMMQMQLRLDFPRYDGTKDPITWIDRAEQFFAFHKTPLNAKVPLVAYHLEGGVHLWFQSFRGIRVWVTSEEFKQAINEYYGPTLLDDFYGELTKLTQMGLVRKYHTQFDRLLVRAGSLIEQQQISCFVSGLWETIRADVRAANPQTLSHAAGYRCKRLFLIDYELEDKEDIDMGEESETKLEVAEISLHAITGTTAPQIMWVPAKVKGRSLVVLLDTGSSHNFLNRA